MGLRFWLWLIAAVASCEGCGGYSVEDATANTIAARHEEHTLEMCASDDAGTCVPSIVRAHALLAFCANARELSAHGKPAPDSGAPCKPQ